MSSEMNVMGKATVVGDRELVITRLIHAPSTRVFAAWSNPQKISQWWGPHGFSTTTKSMDFRSGGSWDFVMHGPDGQDYPNHISYETITPNKLIQYKHGSKAGGEVDFQVIVSFEEQQNGKATLMTFRMLFASAQVLNQKNQQYGVQIGLTQTVSRLDDMMMLLEEASETELPFLISRTFNASREKVWRAWTDEKRLGQWFSPKGFTVPTCSLDLRVGGHFHYCIRSENGQEHWGRWIFREVTEPERLLFVVSFSDPGKNITRNPWNAQWPKEILSLVTFADLGDKTTVTVHWSPINSSGVERQEFQDGRYSMRVGWGGTLDHLDELLLRS